MAVSQVPVLEGLEALLDEKEAESEHLAQYIAGSY